MNRRMILYTLCIVMRVEAMFMAPALIIALVLGEKAAAYGFLLSMLLLLAASVSTYFARPHKRVFYAREGFIIVALGWVSVSLFGALPFFFSGAVPNFIDCLFESVSGFTTTGASVLPDVEALSKSLLYWRSFTHWLGGMGVLVFLLAIMPLSKNAGYSMHVLRAESPGPEVDKLTPRMRNSAVILYVMYVAMTVAQVLFLLAGGMSLFDSVTTAFGTAGTGGFGIMNDSMASYSYYLQNVTTVFMILFGVNFNLYFFLLMRKFRKSWQNLEFWVYIGILAASTVLITINVLPRFAGTRDAFHHASFQVASIMTTTGYATTDFNLWPQFSRTLLMILMFFGACAGSTAGGMKISRLVLLCKSFVRDLRQMVRPRSVPVVRMNGSLVASETIRGARSYLTVYFMVMLAAILLLSLNNLSMETTVTAVISCINNVGPGLDAVGPMGNYGVFSGFSKLVLSAVMLIGRLEMFPMLMLLMPSAWKR
ncbi:MAG TPA: potassium transporter KefA [Clostridiales bacterium]|nr:potassium transporter KefA [Clostridiales bacterium]